MQKLARYRRQALKLAEIELLGGGEGYVARIPGFRGLLATGPTKEEALKELESALIDWIDLALRAGGTAGQQKGRDGTRQRTLSHSSRRFLLRRRLLYSLRALLSQKETESAAFRHKSTERSDISHT